MSEYATLTVELSGFILDTYKFYQNSVAVGGDGGAQAQDMNFGVCVYWNCLQY